MPTNALFANYKSNVKRKPLTDYWRFLQKKTQYDSALHYHGARTNTMPTRIELCNPVVKAIWMYSGAELLSDHMPFQLIQLHSFQTSGSETWYAAEVGLPDSSSLVITVKQNSIRISHCFIDPLGTFITEPLLPFAQESDDTLAAIFLTALPAILAKDTAEYGGKLLSAVQTIGRVSDASTWQSEADIPEEVRNALYYTDIALEIFGNMEFEFGASTSTVAEEVDDSLLIDPTGASTAPKPLAGALVVEYLDRWSPAFLQTTGVAASASVKKMTIAEAKAAFSHYSAHRNWTPAELALIPRFPDQMPVMEETLWLAEAITKTRNSINPVVNAMWRGVTAYGKSTGVKQLAAILNMPLLILTCHPGMEISEFKSSYVPATDKESIELDMSHVTMPASTAAPSSSHPFFAEAMAYVKAKSEAEMAAFLDVDAMLELAFMDSDSVCEMLLGRVEPIVPEQILSLYFAVSKELEQAPLREKIARLEVAGNEDKPKDNAPQFVHVVSPYVKALVNGYLIEIQEASRIRDSGVLVGLNEFDRPEANITLMNGGSARRHKDAICIITDNVGYASCRPIDPSVLRRQGFIIDSYELTREMVIDRVKDNTGCTDNGLLELGYTLWDTVKTHCEHNSITEGSVSPMELERFVQAVMIGGQDSITRNLNNCIISKATSSIEDQREIRAACSTLCSAIVA